MSCIRFSIRELSDGPTISNEGTLEGLTAVGRTTISVLRINDPLRIQHRLLLIELGVFPPELPPCSGE
jgi:hypothetical protein